MSDIMRYGATILRRGSSIARGVACCCNAACCVCAWLDEYWDAGGRLKITFTGGPLSGYVILCPDATEAPPGSCKQWRTTGCAGAFDNLVDHCGLIPTSFDFQCIQDDGMLLQAVMGSGGCAIDNVINVQESCGPPLYLVYTADVIEIAEGACDCEGSVITMTVENLDPWP